MIDSNSFTCPATGFRITKPDYWVWVPGRWVRLDREAVLSVTEEGRRVLKHGQDPIVAFTRPHDDPLQSDPTGQLFRRPFEGPADLEDLGRQITESFLLLFDDVIVEELDANAIAAGTHALRYVAEFTARIDPELLPDDVEELAYRNRTIGHVLLARPYALTLTITTAADEEYRFEDDVRSILSSMVFTTRNSGRRQ